MERYDERHEGAPALIGRSLIALIFLLAGLSKLADFQGTQEYMAAHGMSYTAVFLVAAIAIEVLGALALLLGLRTRFVAGVLVAYLVPVTMIFHGYWTLTGPEMQVQVQAFLKNIAIMGGLLVVAAYGPGRVSVDKRITAPRHGRRVAST